MIDLSKVYFEEKAEYDYSTSYYFTYDSTDLKSVSDRFASKEHYESEYGKVFCMTINMECDIEDDNDIRVCVSPTCEIEDSLSDVDWVDIDVDEETIKALLKKAGEI